MVRIQIDPALAVSAGGRNQLVSDVPVIFQTMKFDQCEPTNQVRGQLARTTALPSPQLTLTTDFPPHRRRGSDGQLARKLDSGQGHGACVVLLQGAHERFSTVRSSSR